MCRKTLSFPNTLFTCLKNVPKTQLIAAYLTWLNQKMLNLENPTRTCSLHDWYPSLPFFSTTIPFTPYDHLHVLKVIIY